VARQNLMDGYTKKVKRKKGQRRPRGGRGGKGQGRKRGEK